MVCIVVDTINHYGDGQLPPAEDVPQLAERVGRLRPLEDTTIESEVFRAIEQALSRFLGTRMSDVLDHLQVAATHKQS